MDSGDSFNLAMLFDGSCKANAAVTNAVYQWENKSKAEELVVLTELAELLKLMKHTELKEIMELTGFPEFSQLTV